MIQINKITLDLYQEADNEVGSEHATIEVKPALISLFDDDKIDYFYTIKTDHGFSFNDKEEILELFIRIEKLIEQSK